MGNYFSYNRQTTVEYTKNNTGSSRNTTNYSSSDFQSPTCSSSVLTSPSINGESSTSGLRLRLEEINLESDHEAEIEELKQEESKNENLNEEIKQTIHEQLESLAEAEREEAQQASEVISEPILAEPVKEEVPVEVVPAVLKQQEPIIEEQILLNKPEAEEINESKPVKEEVPVEVVPAVLKQQEPVIEEQIELNKPEAEEIHESKPEETVEETKRDIETKNLIDFDEPEVQESAQPEIAEPVIESNEEKLEKVQEQQKDEQKQEIIEETPEPELKSEEKVEELKQVEIKEDQAIKKNAEVQFTDKTIPILFYYSNKDANEVLVVGGFNDWKEKIPMIKNGDDFSVTIDLKEGEYQYKFVVDGEWKYDPTQAAIDDNFSGMNNLKIAKISQ